MRRPLALGMTIALLTLPGPAAAQTEPRQRRPSPPQHQVERSIAYFVGRWRVEYVGGEFPPLSAGGRSGTVTFARLGGSNFVAGQFDGELLGKAYRETHTIGFDGQSDTIELIHTARDRRGFAAGALVAARWVKGRTGWFSMQDVLGV